MVVRLFESVAVFRLVQPSKALPPTDVTEFGKVIDVRLAQSRNALMPIVSTLFHIVTVVSDLHF